MRLGNAIPERPGAALRRLIREQPPLIVPGCYNALSARVLEHAGFPAVYMSGYGASLALLGLPDAGLATLTETAMNARLIAAAVRVPVIADADTGFGNAINVVRTIEEYVRAGLAGLHLEDQVAPKRCGHVAGREVIDRAEAVGKIRAAHATRQALDPEFVLIARTDSRGAHGGSLDEAIWRANAFLDAGADLAFVEGPKDMTEVERICTEVKGPVFYNMTGISPRMTREQMAKLGIAVTILPGATLRASIIAMYDLAVALRDQGPMAEAAFSDSVKGHPLSNVHEFAGFDRIRALEETFLPAESAQKYEGTLGHMPRRAAE
ncbi:MAG: isocitrate lyase/PEP mutase family protein [Alphaproteobacteria bacterium]|nr:isocitrate lyase/PEP mutase family protein [Alphaproteobacteria bacterium]